MSTSGLSAELAENDNILVTAKAIRDYITDQGFLGPDALENLGIEDLKDLVTMIESLLNDKTLLIFVHQAGVTYDDIIAGGLKFEVINTKLNGAGSYKTAVWKINPTEDSQLSSKVMVNT